MGANKIDSVMFLACFVEHGDLFHEKLWKCLCNAQDDSKDVFEQLRCSTTPQSHYEITDPVGQPGVTSTAPSRSNTDTFSLFAPGLFRIEQQYLSCHVVLFRAPGNATTAPRLS